MGNYHILMKKPIHSIIFGFACLFFILHPCFSQNAGQQVPIKIPITNTTPNAPWNYRDPFQKYPVIFFHRGVEYRIWGDQWSSQLIGDPIGQKPYPSSEEMDYTSNDSKGKNDFSYNGNLFLAGFSSEVEMVSNYVFHRAWKGTEASRQSLGAPISGYTDSTTNVIDNKVDQLKLVWYKTSSFCCSVKSLHLLI
jgi:hypothetical protein